MYIKATYPSALGEITLVCDDKALRHLSLPGQRGFAEECASGDHPILVQAKTWLDAYFAGNAPSPAALPLRPEGTEVRCGGSFIYTENGIKDCSGCLRPHKRECYGDITAKLSDVIALVKKR